MKKAIIFDFNRTLFDPETKQLVPGARTILTDCLFKGYALFLITRAQATGIEEISNSGIEGIFEQIVVSDKKNVCDLKRLVKIADINIHTSFVVGDSIRDEIRLGNKLGFTTIRVRSGKFASQKPTSKSESATITVSKLSAIRKLLR